MTEDELEEYERRNDNLWNQSGQNSDRYVVVRDLIAEVRRLKSENRAMQSRLDIAEGRAEGMKNL